MFLKKITKREGGCVFLYYIMNAIFLPANEFLASHLPSWFPGCFCFRTPRSTRTLLFRIPRHFPPYNTPNTPRITCLVGFFRFSSTRVWPRDTDDVIYLARLDLIKTSGPTFYHALPYLTSIYPFRHVINWHDGWGRPWPWWYGIKSWWELSCFSSHVYSFASNAFIYLCFDC